jgi:hypothetical protein
MFKLKKIHLNIITQCMYNASQLMNMSLHNPSHIITDIYISVCIKNLDLQLYLNYLIKSVEQFLVCK